MIRFGIESHENNHSPLWRNSYKDLQWSYKIQQPTTVMAKEFHSVEHTVHPSWLHYTYRERSYFANAMIN